MPLSFLHITFQGRTRTGNYSRHTRISRISTPHIASQKSLNNRLFYLFFGSVLAASFPLSLSPAISLISISFFPRTRKRKDICIIAASIYGKKTANNGAKANSPYILYLYRVRQRTSDGRKEISCLRAELPIAVPLPTAFPIPIPRMRKGKM